MAGLLRSTRIAGRPEEYFWGGDRAFWSERWKTSSDTEFVERALQEGTTENGVFGARVMWTYLADVVEMLRATRVHGATRHEALAAILPNLHCIFLTRRDIVAQAVSWAKAIQSNEWFEGDERTTHTEPRYDPELIEQLIQEIARGNESWTDFFSEASVGPHHAIFEDLVADPDGATRAVLTFLGLQSPSAPIVPTTAPQTDATNRDWIRRYQAERRNANGLS